MVNELNTVNTNKSNSVHNSHGVYDKPNSVHNNPDTDSKLSRQGSEDSSRFTNDINRTHSVERQGAKSIGKIAIVVLVCILEI